MTTIQIFAFFGFGFVGFAIGYYTHKRTNQDFEAATYHLKNQLQELLKWQAELIRENKWDGCAPELRGTILVKKELSEDWEARIKRGETIPGDEVISALQGDKVVVFQKFKKKWPQSKLEIKGYGDAMRYLHVTVQKAGAIVLAILLTMTSCKKSHEGTTGCWTCMDQTGNTLNVICAPSEQEAYNEYQSSTSDSVTVDEFRQRCPYSH